MFREAAGDLWSHPADYRVITTNGVYACEWGTRRPRLVMGAGVARQAAERFPDLPYTLGAHVLRYGNRAFVLHAERLITCPTKDDWKKPAIPELVDQSLAQVVAIADKYALRSVAMPRPGCGLGGLDWETKVKPLCRKHLDDRFTVLTPEA